MVTPGRTSTDKKVINRGYIYLHPSGDTVALNSKQVLAINYSPDSIEWIYFHAKQTPPAPSPQTLMQWGKTGKTIPHPWSTLQVCHKGSAGWIIGVFGHMQISAISSW